MYAVRHASQNVAAQHGTDTPFSSVVSSKQIAHDVEAEMSIRGFAEVNIGFRRSAELLLNPVGTNTNL